MSTSLDLQELAESFRSQAKRLTKAANALDPPQARRKPARRRRQGSRSTTQSEPRIPEPVLSGDSGNNTD